MSDSVSITLGSSSGTTLTCLGGFVGVFFTFAFLKDSVILLACADLDLGLPTLGFTTGTCGVCCADLVLGLPTLGADVQGLSAI